MYKLILRDYRTHWRSGLKKMYNNGPSFFAIWFIVMFSPDEVPAFYGIYIPFLLTLLLSRMYGGYLNKTLFLCPLDKTTRQEYAAKSIRLRIIIPTALFLVINFTLLACNMISIIIFLLALFIFLCMGVYLNMYCQPIVINTDTKETIYPVLGDYTVHNALSHICSYFNMLILSEFSELTERPDSFEIILFAFFVISQFFLSINMVRKLYKQILRATAFYN